MGILSRLEQKSSNAPDWGTLERFLSWSFGGGASSSGIIVSPQTALQTATVFSCVRVLAESVGMLPFNLYRDGSKNSLQVAKDHALFELLHNQPNDFQSSVEFWEMMVMSLCLRGNAYAYVNRASSGRVVEILPVHPDMMRVEMSNGYQLTYYATLPDGSFKPFVPGDIFHVRGLTLNGWLGVSPIAYARESIGLALATEKFGAQLFRNGAKMGGTLEHPQKLSDEAYNRLKNSFDAAHSGENAHRTAILEEGLKFNKVSMTADDAQFLATRKYQRSEICGIFRVPPHMAGDLERATFSNIEQQSLDFINTALMPWLRRIEQAIRRDLFSAEDKKTLHGRFNVATLLRGDAAARGAFYHAGILDGWLTRNEARLMESDLGFILNPLPELDMPLQPLNMEPAGSEPDGDETDPALEAGKPVGKRALKALPIVAATKALDERTAALLRVNASHLARRIAAKDRVDAKAIAAAMAIPQEMAAAWCADQRPDVGEEALAASLVKLAGGFDGPLPAVPQALTVNIEQPAVNINAPVTVQPQSITIDGAQITVQPAAAPDVHISAPITAHITETKNVQIVARRLEDGSLLGTAKEITP